MLLNNSAPSDLEPQELNKWYFILKVWFKIIFVQFYWIEAEYDYHENCGQNIRETSSSMLCTHKLYQCFVFIVSILFIRFCAIPYTKKRRDLFIWKKLEKGETQRYPLVDRHSNPVSSTGTKLVSNSTYRQIFFKINKIVFRPTQNM